MITGFQMYTLLMLDNIRFLLAVLCFLSVPITIMTGCILVLCSEHELKDRERKMVSRWAKNFTLTFLVSVVSWTFLPSTKQAAAIYVVPMILSEGNTEVIKKESGELYGLFKQWATEQVSADLKNTDSSVPDKTE